MMLMPVLIKKNDPPPKGPPRWRHKHDPIRQGPTLWDENLQCWVGEGWDFMDWLEEATSFRGPTALDDYNHACDLEHAGLTPRFYTKK